MAIKKTVAISTYKKLKSKNKLLNKQLEDVKRFTFNSQEPFQLLVNIKGESKLFIRRELQKLLESLDDDYGKPKQGIIISYGGETNIVTRIWNGELY